MYTCFVKPLNQYQFNEWRPHIYEETATYAAPGMSENTMVEMYKRGEGDRIHDSLTEEKTGKYSFEWHNPARREVIDSRNMFPQTNNSGFSSRRKAHDAAMDFMLDRSGTPEDLSTTDGSVMYEDTSSRWENFHRNQGHAIKYEDD